MDINTELKGKKTKKKNNKNKIPEKFKNYTQDINLDNEFTFPEEYLKIHEQMLDIDLNQPNKLITKDEMSYLEKITKEQCLEVLKVELEENDIKIKNKIPPNKQELDKIISDSDKFNMDLDIEKDDNIEDSNKTINKDIKKSSINNLENKYISENLNEKYKFKLGKITLLYFKYI